MHPWQSRLISLIKERPVLYDTDHKDYHDSKGLRYTAWMEVVQGLQQDGYGFVGSEAVGVKFVQSKWRNMRDIFIKALKKYEEKLTQNGNEDVSVPKLPYFKDMYWLLPYQKKTRRVPDETMDIVMKSYSEQESATIESILAETPKVPSEPPKQMMWIKRKSVNTGLSNFDTKAPKLKKLLLSNDIVKSACKSLDIPSPKSEFDDSDDEMFGKLVVKKLKYIPVGMTKEKLKLDIFKLLFDAQYPSSRGTDPSVLTTLTLAPGSVSVPVVTTVNPVASLTNGQTNVFAVQPKPLADINITASTSDKIDTAFINAL